MCEQQSQLVDDSILKEIVINFLCNVASELFCSELFKTQQVQEEFQTRLKAIEDDQLEIKNILTRIEGKLDD